MKKILLASLVLAMVFSFGLVAGEVLAFPGGGKVGQPEDHDGTVTRVEFDEIEVEGYTWYLVMPYRGDFGGTPYLEDGWIMNVYTDRQGNFVLYFMVHESDARWSEDLEPIYGSWALFKQIFVGKAYSGGQ